MLREQRSRRPAHACSDPPLPPTTLRKRLCVCLSNKAHNNGCSPHTRLGAKTRAPSPPPTPTPPRQLEGKMPASLKVNQGHTVRVKVMSADADAAMQRRAR